jgi:hypothetical protein
MSIRSQSRRGAALLAMFVSNALAQQYTVEILQKVAEPAISIGKPLGQGHSPCNYTFNPAWLNANPPYLNQSILIFRAAECPESYGGASDHLLFAYCNSTGVCGDVQPLQFNFEPESEDPRVVFYEGFYYLYYYANGPGQQTVYLRRTQTPLQPASWEVVVGELPWHRNGCVLLRQDGNHYVIFGETYGPAQGPLPGIGIANTSNFINYTYINTTWMEPLFNNTEEPEVCLEASTPPVQLSTGDYLHFYSAVR